MRRVDLILISAGLVAALPLAVVPTLLVLTALLGLALWMRPRGRESWVASSAILVLALGLLLWAPSEPLDRRLQEGYEEIWQSLDREAESARRVFEAEGVGARETSFDRLSALASGGDATLFLLDRFGEPLAWAGSGVVHELPEARKLGKAGFVGSFGSITLFVVDEIAEHAGRVVAARSFSTQRLPFLDPRELLDWSLVEAHDELSGDAQRIEIPGRPTLVLRAGESLDRERRYRYSAWVLAVFMLLLAGTRWVRGEAGALSASAWAAAAAIAALQPSMTTLVVFYGGLMVAAAGYSAWNREGRGRGGATLRGLVVGGLLLLATFLARLVGELPDLGGEFLLGEVDVAAARVGIVALATGLLLLAGRAEASGRGGKLAILGLLAGAWLANRPEWAVPLVLLAAAGSARWLASHRESGRARALFGALALGALLAGVTGEITYRARLRVEMRDSLMSGMARPGHEELESLRQEVQKDLENLDLDRILARPAARLESEDLAFILWRNSPLARRDALSALVVDRDLGRDSHFSFGLPLDGGHISDERARWQGLVPPGWQNLLIEGEAPFLEAGELGGRVLFWIQPRPGFRLQALESGEELEAGLLKGEPTSGFGPEGLPDAYLFGLYDLDGRPLLPPWPAAARLDALPGDEGEARLSMPGGSAWARWQRGDDEIRVIYLPEASLGKAYERLGVYALGGLLPFFVLGVVAFVGLLGRADYRILVTTSLRSYSRRLLVVNALLLILPLAVLNLVFFGAVEQRIERDQRADGEATLASAQRVLGEYLLSLEPGFALETTLDDSLLTWLSRVLQREVSLYWGSREYASSKRELFSTGLLPRRLPGQVYVDLRISGRELASRRIRAGDASFVVLYARLDVPGVPTSEQRFVVSVPLLAQQEDVSRELDSLRRTVALATITLLALLGLAGASLASDFTRPIRDLVEGTRRIAEGAPGLNLKPSDFELAALVEAIDDMAERIAQGRERLVSEKHLVDRMVDSITSGVVSLDKDGRVLMANRVAIEWLGVEPGRRFEESVLQRQWLEPLASFVGQAGAYSRQVTLRLDEPEPKEWTAVWVPLAGEGDPDALVVVEDVTEVLRVERLEAWAEMARIIAHEIKNPLTPIRLSAELLSEVYAHDPERLGEVFDRCTGNILRQVEELRQIASEFSDYSQVMKPDPDDGDLGQTVTRVVEDYLVAPPPGVELELDVQGGPHLSRFDVKLLARTVRNLLENAIRASSGQGTVAIAVHRRGDKLEVTVGDQGPGIPTEHLPRIFEPYFTTHESGTGLGLAIAKRIVEEHGGRIEARNRQGGGLEVCFWIPAS